MIALHVLGIFIIQLQEHKTSVTTASANRYAVLLSVADSKTIRCNGYQML